MNPTVTQKQRERERKIMIEGIFETELINYTRIEDRNKIKARSGISKGIPQRKVESN